MGMDDMQKTDPYIDAAENFVEGGHQQNQNAGKMKRMNWMFWLLISFIMYWMYSTMLNRVDANTDSINNNVRFIYVEPVLDNILNNIPLNTNYFTDSLLVSNFNVTNITNNTLLMYTEENSYSPGDIVVIKYFNITGIVLEKASPKKYKILYKNQDNSLMIIELPIEFLLKPTRESLMPRSLKNL